MIKKQGQPISGGAAQFRPKPPVLSTPFTSQDAQKLIKQPPKPFANPYGTLQPVPTNRAVQHPYGSSAGGVKPRKWTAAQPVSQPMSTAQMLAALGEPRLPKGYNSINSGFPQRGFMRSTGPRVQPFAKGRKGR